MADLTELKNMVMSFRVSELQVLLGFAGRNKSGRKQELLQRALTLLHRQCNHPIQIKIKELYRRRYPGKPSTSPPHPVQPPSRMASGTANIQSKRERDRANWMKYPSSNMSSRGVHYNSSLLGYNKPSLSTPSQSSTIPIHPDVRYKWLPFYDVLGELLKTSSLVPRSQNRFQENVFVFHLTPQQAQEIAMSRDLRPGARCEFTVQVQLRFSLLETSCPQEDNFPPSVCVRVNDKLATLPNPIPTNKPGVEPKRPSRPVNITSICRLSPTVANQVNVTWASEYGRSYCVCVSLVRRLSADILLQRLKSSGIRHPDHTRALIKEKLFHDPDSEIATTSLRVSLLCPLGKMRMGIPCRASTCTHLQCFDATTYLQMNEKKPSWTCPVCDRPAEFDKLTIDGLFTEILNQVTETLEIELLDDGSWQPMKPKETSEKPSSQVIQTIGDSPKKPEPDVIDLTETDDEDDMAVINTSTCSDSSSSTSDSSIITATPTSSNHDSEDVKIIGPSISSSSSVTNLPSGGLTGGASSSHHGSITGARSPMRSERRDRSRSPVWLSTRRSASPPGVDLRHSRSPQRRSPSRRSPQPRSPARRTPPPRSSSMLTPPRPSHFSSSHGPESQGLFGNPPPRASSFRSGASLYPGLPRFPEPPPLVPISMPDTGTVNLPPPLPDYFRSDVMDIENLDLYNLMQDTDSEREFDFLRSITGDRSRGAYGGPSTSEGRPGLSRSDMARTSAHGSRPTPTPTFSISSSSSGNHGDRSSPDCIAID